MEKFNEQVVLSWAQPDHLGMVRGPVQVRIIRAYAGSSGSAWEELQIHEFEDLANKIL